MLSLQLSLRRRSGRAGCHRPRVGTVLQSDPDLPRAYCIVSFCPLSSERQTKAAVLKSRLLSLERGWSDVCLPDR